jgi:hypothetical protein
MYVLGVGLMDIKGVGVLLGALVLACFALVYGFRCVGERRKQWLLGSALFFGVVIIVGGLLTWDVFKYKL